MLEYIFLVKDFFLLKTYFVERDGQVFLIKIDLLEVSSTENITDLQSLKEPYQQIITALLQISGTNISHEQETKIRDYLYPFLSFEGLPVILQSILLALAENIKRGEITSYKDLAIKLNLSASYARVVGRAMARNPFPVLYPCHRVVTSHRTLGKKFGVTGGLLIKDLLLRREGVTLDQGTLYHTTN